MGPVRVYQQEERHEAHWAAAAAALLVSLAIHGTLFWTLPPFHVGRPTDAPVGRSALPRRMHVDTVALAAHAVDQVPTSPWDPDRTAAQPAIPEQMLAPLAEDPFRLTLAAFPDLLPAADSPALAPPSPLEPSVFKDALALPRPELLRIEELRIPTEEARLPRRIDPVPERQATFPEGHWDVSDLAPDVAGIPPATPRPEVVSGLPALEEILTATALGLPPGLTRGPGTTATARGVDWIEEPPEPGPGLEATEDLLDWSLDIYRPEAGAHVYFRMHIQRKAETELPVLGRDVLFLQDASESMTRRILEECKRGWLRWLDWLGPEDRFNIISFRDQPYRCFGNYVPADDVHKARARIFIQEITPVGRTDIMASLREVLRMPGDVSRPLLVVLISDGHPTTGITDAAHILEQFTRLNDGRAAVYGLAVGRDVNRFLLDLMAYRNRGDTAWAENREGIRSLMERWALELRRPVMHHLAYQAVGLDRAQIYPRTLPHLFLDRPLALFGRIREQDRNWALRIIGQAGARRHEILLSPDYGAGMEGGNEIRRQWAQHRMLDLVAQYSRTRTPEILETMHTLSRAYGIPYPYPGALTDPSSGTGY